MMTRFPPLVALLIALTVHSGRAQSALPAQQEVVATINLAQTGTPITKYHFGQFIENLGNADVGNLVDDGLWAELIDDRKFFYPVDTVTRLMPVNKRNRVRQWMPLGSSASVRMDSTAAYVGVHSPRIATTAQMPAGIQQAELMVQANQAYTGRIVLRGTSAVRVTVSLEWGDRPSERLTMALPTLTDAYRTYPLRFDKLKRGGYVRLVIAGIGTGDFSVGAVSLMPADNVDGFRPDVVRLLKGLNSGLYRWGGNFISGYDWRDAIGDPDRRPPRYEYAWEAVESNDVGTHEMLRFAELIGVELAMTVNAGLGDASSAAQWVEYVNGNLSTPQGKHRARNGHPAPYGVRLWCVGNESYGWWQLGHTNLKSHLIKHRQFAAQMKAVDPTIQLIGAGAALEEMTITGSSLRETGKIVAEYDSASDWTGGMLRQNLTSLDFISEHFYCSVDERFDVKLGRYVPAQEPVEDWTRRPANRVRAKVENYDEYRRRIPAFGASQVRVYLDEWAYYTNWVHPTPTLGVTIGYARALNEMLRHTDLIAMTGFTFGTSCLSFTDTSAAYNTTGLLFQLYQSQLGRIPVLVTGNVPQPAPTWPVGGEQPRINAGSPTYPLDLFAALTPDRTVLTVAVINPTETPQHLTLRLTGGRLAGSISKWLLSGTGVRARNVVGQLPAVQLTQTQLSPQNQLSIEPVSIAVYRYQLAQ